MRAAVGILACLASAALAVAAPPSPPTSAVKVTVGELARVEITPDKAGSVGWASGAADADLFVDELSTKAEKVRLLVQAKRAGTYRIVLWTKGETSSTFVEVVAGSGDDQKQDDTKPPPTPKPVEPASKPPFDSPDGLRVMIVYDGDNLTLPAKQATAMSSGRVFAWLNANCVLGPDGKTREWRKYPTGTDVSNDKAVWQAAFKAATPSGRTPRIAIASKDKGFVGDLPADETGLLELLAKYK